MRTFTKPRCPQCFDETNLEVERRPDGDARCRKCGWAGPYRICFVDEKKVILESLKKIKDQLLPSSIDAYPNVRVAVSLLDDLIKKYE